MTNDELIERMAETIHDTDAVGDFPSHEAWCKGLAKAALTVAQAEYLPVVEKLAGIGSRIYNGCAKAEWGRAEDYRELNEALSLAAPLLKGEK